MERTKFVQIGNHRINLDSVRDIVDALIPSEVVGRQPSNRIYISFTGLGSGENIILTGELATGFREWLEQKATVYVIA